MQMEQTAGLIPAYRPSHWIIRDLVNPLTRLLVGKMGMDDHNGTRILEVKGRKSGIWHATPVRLLELNGRRYLVALQGETQWVRNLRVQGAGRIKLGEHVTDFAAVELADSDKLPVLRVYLERWWSQSASLTRVTSSSAPDEEILRAAPTHPVFLLQ